MVVGGSERGGVVSLQKKLLQLESFAVAIRQRQNCGGDIGLRGELTRESRLTGFECRNV